MILNMILVNFDVTQNQKASRRHRFSRIVFCSSEVTLKFCWEQSEEILHGHIQSNVGIAMS